MVDYKAHTAQRAKDIEEALEFYSTKAKKVINYFELLEVQCTELKNIAFAQGEEEIAFELGKYIERGISIGDVSRIVEISNILCLSAVPLIDELPIDEKQTLN